MQMATLAFTSKTLFRNPSKRERIADAVRSILYFGSHGDFGALGGREDSVLFCLGP